MSEDELFCYEIHLPRLRAKEVLRKAQYGEISLNRAGWYDTVLAATGDKLQAEEAANAYSREQLKNERDPG